MVRGLRLPPLFYDAENHQKEVRDSGGFVIGQYFYDGDGRRVKKVASDETTIFVYDAGGALVAEYSTFGSPTAEGILGCVLEIRAPNSYYQGSPNADVAELVDAQVSEACGRKAVEVRFFSSAPKNHINFADSFSRDMEMVWFACPVTVGLSTHVAIAKSFNAKAAKDFPKVRKAEYGFLRPRIIHIEGIWPVGAALDFFGDVPN